MRHETEPNDTPDLAAPEDQRNDSRRGGGSHSDAKNKLPGAPSSEDDSEVGDTDQHSSA